jgi:hypothetical protein
MRCILKKSTTSRIFIRASQPPRNKTLLSKLATRVRRRKSWLSLSEEEEEEENDDEDEKNMMNKRWLYSSRNSISS